MGRNIRVTGKGKISIKPDLIVLSISTKKITEEYELTVKASARDKEDLLLAIEPLGFTREDLKTTYFYVDTEFENYKDEDDITRKRFIGYSYTHRMKLSFPADTKMLGRILYILAHCSCNPDFSVHYTTATPEVYKNKLLAKAVEDSRLKAQILAEAAGVELGEVELIDYSWQDLYFRSSPMNDMIYEACSLDGEGAYDIDIEPDDIEASDNVTVVWKIK